MLAVSDWWEKIVNAGLAFPVIFLGMIVGGLILSIIFGKRTPPSHGS